MAMGRVEGQDKQQDLWIAHTELASAPGHPFYEKLNELLKDGRFDAIVEGVCAKFYAHKYGRPSLPIDTPRFGPRSVETQLLLSYDQQTG